MACPILEKKRSGVVGLGDSRGGSRKDWEESSERKQCPGCEIIIKIITKVMRD